LIGATMPADTDGLQAQVDEDQDHDDQRAATDS
jgi:hypothetical protein